MHQCVLLVSVYFNLLFLCFIDNGRGTNINASDIKRYLELPSSELDNVNMFFSKDNNNWKINLITDDLNEDPNFVPDHTD